MVASHRYEVRVVGVVPPDVVLDFDDLCISVEPIVTMIHGSLPDQAALYGLLARPVQQTRVARLFLGPAAFPVAVFFEVVHQVADRQAGVLGRSVSSPIRASSGLRFWKIAMWAPRTSSDPHLRRAAARTA